MTAVGAAFAGILLAGGGSSRFSQELPKPLWQLGGSTILDVCVQKLLQCVDSLVVTVPQQHERQFREVLGGYSEVSVVCGGASRQQSVHRAMQQLLNSNVKYLLIHDCARPLVSVADIQAVQAAAREHGAAILAAPLADSPKRSTDGLLIDSSISRDGMYVAQTPQCFGVELFASAMQHAATHGIDATDDSQLVEQIGHLSLIHI